MVRAFEVELLSSQGYNLLEADSGAEALRIARTATIHLLLTDFSMPDLDGLELTRRVRSIQPEMPVLMVSGSLPSTDNRIENLARFEWLPKPFEFDELLQKVRMLIQNVYGDDVRSLAIIREEALRGDDLQMRDAGLGDRGRRYRDGVSEAVSSLLDPFQADDDEASRLANPNNAPRSNIS